MNIGIPKESKAFEGRVALTPTGCRELIDKAHRVFIEQGAGRLSGFCDVEYQQLGVTVLETPQELYQQAELIVKVKEPVGDDLNYLTDKHTLFCFLHLAANQNLVGRLISIGLTAVAFEEVKEKGVLPILKPMSVIAGKLSMQIGTNLLHLQHGGSGLLLGGLDQEAKVSVDKGRVLVLGAGSAGSAAALLADRMGADVFVFDSYPLALNALKTLSSSITVINNEEECLSLLPSVDLLIGALLVPGKKTPRLIKRSHLKGMQNGSVIVDISIDQGGCIETSRVTSYDKPTFVKEGVTHFCVANMPGAVPRTATQAISALLPSYIDRLTLNNWYENDKIMREAVLIRDGKESN
ncbi:MAG: alanine dehydrogenase [Cycloclasticus sp. symbiont of Bathymodiolus heckerae]|nr:MAG: alanine dehydrogenase [Cycloclasticus sp. symbiont of Bathymodiolus heckerae]